MTAASGRPRALRSDRAVLPALAIERAAAVLASPLLPPAAVEVATLACAAAPLGVPVCLAAPPALRTRLARALHATAARPGPLLAVTGPRPPRAPLPAGATLLVDADALAPAALLALEALLDDGDAWIVVAAASVDALPPGLAARLAGGVVAVPPLAARPDALAALADAHLAALAERSGHPAPALADDARAALRAHAWPGDVPELEAALARAVVLAADGPVTAAHLRLAVPPPAVVASPAPRPRAEPSAADAAVSRREAALELLLAEMAHELKNPLVTIKTFADHLPELLEDRTLRDRFALLADEAIERMDGLLENVLAFARLGLPEPQPVAVGPLLDRLAAEVAPALAERQVQVRRAGSDDTRCAADPEHVAYALRNLLAGVVREVAPQEDVVVDTSMNGVVRVGFATGAAAATRLKQLASPDAPVDVGDPTLLPLAFTLARAVLERNGGSLGVQAEASGRTALVVRLPVAADA